MKQYIYELEQLVGQCSKHVQC